jgi:hypothetical protein
MHSLEVSRLNQRAVRVEDLEVAARSSKVGFPTEPGIYESQAWRYQYSIELSGTRSERRVGELFENGMRLEDAPGQILETPLGRFAFFAFPYNQGWLNTLTYDRPVFTEDGRLTKDANFYVKHSDEGSEK